MGCLLLFALLASSTTPYDEIEAWDPSADTGGSTQTSPAQPNDNGAQAFSALKPAIGGVALGVGTAIVAVFVGAIAASALSSGPFGAAFYIAGVVTAIGAFAMAPALTVAIFASELPGWTPWLTTGAVVIGSAVGVLAGTVAGNTYVNARSPPGSDCRLCGTDTMLAAFGLPALGGAVGAVLGAAASTTIGAFAE